jgi:hypothetical protein
MTAATCLTLINQENAEAILLKKFLKTHTTDGFMKPGVWKKPVSHHKDSTITKYPF